MKMRTGKNNKGIALIVTVGILAMMLIIGTSFTINMIVDYKSAVNMAVSAQAKDAAEAGLNLAIISARNAALGNFTALPTSVSPYTVIPAQPATIGPISLGNVGMGNTAAYSVTITDTASQINVNVVDNIGLNNPTAPQAVMLENLVAILGGPLQAGDGNAIIANRPAGGYITKEQIISAIPPSPPTSANLAARTAKYNAIAPYITVNSYIDQNSESTTAMPLTGLADPNISGNPSSSIYQAKAPININSASTEVLQAVLRPIITDTNKALALANAIKAEREITFFRVWNDQGFSGGVSVAGFDHFIETVDLSPAAALTATEKTNIKNNANPNRVKPSGYSTDFCFHPSGIYEITSTGTAGPARKQITAIVQVYKILNYTTKEQFRADTYAAGPSLPVFLKATWLNSCPVEMNNADPAGSIVANYKTIPNSLKLGYWDNFEEDNDNSNSFGYSWKSFSQETSTYPMNIGLNGTGSNKLWGSGFPKFTLDSARWAFGNNFSLRVYLKPNVYGDGNESTGSVEFHSAPVTSKAKLWIQHWGFYYDKNTGRRDITRPPDYWKPSIAIDPDGVWDWTKSDTFNSKPKEGKDFYDSRVFLELLDPPQNERIYRMGDLYGLVDPITDHYDTPPTTPSHYYGWATEQNNDQHHGIFPDYQTFKLVVNSNPGVLTPNYRVWLALGTASHRYYNYSNGWSLGSYLCGPPTSGYTLVPFHSDGANSAMGDRYNYWPYSNSQPNSWRTTYWYLVLYGNSCDPCWDDLRIIPDSGYYQSPSFSPGGSVRWGTVSWTLTIPETADASKELCLVQVNTGGGLSGNLTINGPIGGISNSEVFKVNLSSSDDDYSETPVFEDITITYLPKASVLYLR